MLCGNCPLALPCFAGRLYEGRTQGMLCPLCKRFTIVHFQVYEATTQTPLKEPVVFTITALDMGNSLAARDNLKARHTVIHCPDRKLTEAQIEYWQTHQQHMLDHRVAGGVCGSIPYSMCDLHPSYSDNNDVRLNVVPCVLCEPQRYGKAVVVEIDETRE